jgi:hypothetical protein
MQVIQTLMGTPDAPRVMLELVLSQSNLDDLASDPEHRGFLAKPLGGDILMVRVEDDSVHYPKAWDQPVQVQMPGGRG